MWNLPELPKLRAKVQEYGLDTFSRIARTYLGEKRLHPKGYKTLTKWQKETLRALIGRLCHYPNLDVPAPDEIGTPEATQKYLRQLPKATQREFRQLLGILEAGPVIVAPGSHRARYTDLPLEARDAYLSWFTASDIAEVRAIFQGLKSACMMGFWSKAETWDAIGYSIQNNPGAPARLKQIS